MPQDIKTFKSDHVLCGLDGQELKTSEQDPTPFTAGKALAMLLASVSMADLARCGGFKTDMDWFSCARAATKGNDIVLEKAEREVLITLLKAFPHFTLVIGGQLLELLSGPGADAKVKVERLSPGDEGFTKVAEALLDQVGVKTEAKPKKKRRTRGPNKKVHKAVAAPTEESFDLFA